MNIILIGMRGSGKTIVAGQLAKKLHKKFIETDDLIVKKIGLPISEIVAKFGWKKFRDLESEVIKKIRGVDDTIISTGGGVVLNKDNRRILKQNGRLIWLSADIEELVKRIGNNKDRPFLIKTKSRKKDIETTFKQRERLYRQAADYVIDTNNKNPSKVAAEITKIIEIL
jgi:shikimate kinase